MRVVRSVLPPGAIPYAPIYGGIAALAVVTAALVVSLPPGLLPALCPFRRITGFPCPTCGATRALAALAAGHVGSAFAFNPLATAAVLCLGGAGAVSALGRLMRLPRIRLVMRPAERTALRFGAVAVVAANWVYLLAST